VKKDVDYIILGCLGRVHGIKGFITVHSYTEPRENILNYKPWHFLKDKRWQPLNVLQMVVNDKHILAQIEGFSERESAAQLTHVKIGVPKSELPDLSEGEYYWHDLIGLSVQNTEGVILGKVTEIMPTGSNDVLIVEAVVDKASEEDKAEAKSPKLIPYLPGDTIVAVDLKQQKIIVAWNDDW
jgi:16S rRNA processing protein RimM